jgi:hypothetical protein
VLAQPRRARPARGRPRLLAAPLGAPLAAHDRLRRDLARR